MHIKNKKDIIKYQQQTQTGEDIINDEIKREIERKDKQIIFFKEENNRIKNEQENIKTYILIQKIKNEYANEINKKNGIIKKLEEEINFLNSTINK